MLSGFAALTYQIVWQRLLVLPMGADVYSTTIVVGVFMAGLGLGSLAGGRIADRLAPSRCILVFIGAELAVGLFGVFSDAVLYDWLYLRAGRASIGSGALAAIVFAVLLWPTFWMGVSLPVLGRAIAGGLQGAAARVGLLYGLNTIGAATGAFVTTWVLFPRLGLAGSVHFAAALNVLAAVAATPLLRLINGPREAVEDSTRAAPAVRHHEAWPFAIWAALYGLAGFQALSLEVVWFRLLGVMVKSSAFTFGTLLTIYLLGLGVGAAAGSAALPRISRPGRAFLLLQAFVGLYAGASLLALVSWLPRSPALATLWSYLAGYEPLDAASAFATIWSSDFTAAHAQFLRLYVWLPLALVGPPTLAMGASFPMLQRVAIVDPRRVGRRIAAVLLSNIAGSTAGAILTGWLALTYLGSSGTLQLMAALGGIYLALAFVCEPPVPRRRVAMAIGAIAIGMVLTSRMPGSRRLWASVHGTTPLRIETGEDATGLSVIKTDPAASTRRTVVFVNGIGQSWIPYGDIHTVLGALPAFIHPDPKTAVVIGLGSGDTVYAVAGRPGITRLTCVEIIAPQLATLRQFSTHTPYPPLLTLLSDPRIEHIAGDGRAYVMRSRQQFDLIEADALRPASAYSGNLYSAGYFRLLQSQLTPGGLAVTWGPTPRVHDTFASVFPHVISFGDILVGSRTPIAFDADAIRARVRQPAVLDHFWRAGIDIDALLAPYLQNPRPIAGPREALADLNEDLFPRDEFTLPRTRRR